MCEDAYNYLEAFTIGGPAGDYILRCPMDSCKWAEYNVMSVVSGDTGPVGVTISGHANQSNLPYDGSVPLDNTTAFRGQAYRMGAFTTLLPSEEYLRIIDPQHRVFIHISAPNNISAFVTIRFRVMPIKQVLGRTLVVHEDHEVQRNIARADAIHRRLNAETFSGEAAK